MGAYLTQQGLGVPRALTCGDSFTGTGHASWTGVAAAALTGWRPSRRRADPRLPPGVGPWRRRASWPSAEMRHRVGSRSNQQRRDLTRGRWLHISRPCDPRPGPIRSPGGTKHSRDSTRPRRGAAMGVLGCLEEGRHSVGHRGPPTAEAPIQEQAGSSGLGAPHCASGGFWTVQVVLHDQQTPQVFQPLSAADVRGLLSTFPADVRAELQSVHLRLGRLEDEMKQDGAEPDPMTGRPGFEEGPVWTPPLRGPLESITSPEEIGDWEISLHEKPTGRPLSVYSPRKCHKPLALILGDAVTAGLITRNAAAIPRRHGMAASDARAAAAEAELEPQTSPLHRCAPEGPTPAHARRSLLPRGSGRSSGCMGGRLAGQAAAGQAAQSLATGPRRRIRSAWRRFLPTRGTSPAARSRSTHCWRPLPIKSSISHCDGFDRSRDASSAAVSQATARIIAPICRAAFAAP